jgi:hypothetical protein
MKGWIIFALIGGVLLATGLSLAVENKGAADMVLTGGERGNVPFPHLRHQNKLEDCQICHDVFPQEKGAIDRLKQQGKLKPKAVMNKQCTKCHKEKRRAGEKSGPVTCKQCHVK